MKRFFQVWFNRVSAVFYIGALTMSLILFCNPYVNVLILFVSFSIILGGGAYVTEELKHTAGERLFMRKLYKLFD
jgi:hypothetical protein